MIIGKLKELHHYLNLHPNLDTAIHALSTLDLETLPMGKTIIDKDNVFINRFDYVGLDLKDCFFEGHRHYLDIHIVLGGKEHIGYANIKDLQAITEYNEADDFTKYEGDIATYCQCQKGDFIVTFPEDIHMPKISSTHEAIRKCVVKVKVL